MWGRRPSRAWIAVAGAAASLGVLLPAAHADHDATFVGDDVVVTYAGPLTLRAGGPSGLVTASPATYYATRDGGFVGRGGYLITVVGDRGTTRYTSSTPCAGTGVIRAGDRVHIRVDAGFVAAGSSHHC